MKTPVSLPLLPFLLMGVVAAVPSPLRSAPASNPPGTREVYTGTVCEYADAASSGDQTTAAIAARRAGRVQLEVVNGTVTGRFTFPVPGGTATGFHGYLDPMSNRGFLKLEVPDADGSQAKLPLLLRRGVLTGGTMDADGRVLAFRLERFLVVLP